MTEPPAGFSAWATPADPPDVSADAVGDALAARGLHRAAGLDALLAHERTEALRSAYRRVSRLARGGQGRGSWTQAAALLHRMLGGEP